MLLELLVFRAWLYPFPKEQNDSLFRLNLSSFLRSKPVQRPKIERNSFDQRSNLPQACSNLSIPKNLVDPVTIVYQPVPQNTPNEGEPSLNS